MDIKPTLKLRLLLALFTVFIGSHAFIIQWEVGFYIRNLIRVDILGITSINLNRFTIEFLFKILISMIIGTFVFSRFHNNFKISRWDKTMLSCLTFLFLITFAKIGILQMFSSGSSYLFQLNKTLYLTPIFFICGFYILPRYITGDEYKPWKAFLGGIKLCSLLFLIPLIYEGYLYEFIGYVLIDYNVPSFYYSYLLVFPISGVSAWVAQLYLYRHREMYWKNNAEIFS